MEPLKSVKRPVADRSQDVYRLSARPLDSLFKPKSVAIVGATEKVGSVGRSVFWNLLRNPFGGVVYPVNPKHSHLLGVRTYPSLSTLPEVPDLVVIATPAPTVPAIVEECVSAGVPSVIIISAGFKETGPEGQALEDKILATARKGRIRIIGPNCLGVMTPPLGLNSTFANEIAMPGRVAFLSQSGALGTAILDWSLKSRVGLSAFVSVGSMLDVGWGDLIDYFGSDPQTTSIVIYMESIGDARSFLSAAREVVLTKPIVVIKAGRTGAAAQAAASHTGSLAGNDEVLDAAFERCGVLRVDTIAEVFDLADILSKQPRPRGNRLTILTNAGGPGVLATDSLIRRGGQLADLQPGTEKTLNQFLPSAWSHHNPIDLLGDAEPERYAKALEVVAKDEGTDGLLVILTPQAMTDPTATAEKLRPFARIEGKPVFASWMGGQQVLAGSSLLSQAGIPVYEYPDDAVRTFVDLWRFSYNLRGLYETPLQLPEFTGKQPQKEETSRILKGVRGSGRALLTESESKDLLASYGIPAVRTLVAGTPKEAGMMAAELGFPVVVKLNSQTVTHKTDVGGVKLNLNDAAEVEKAFRDIERSVAEKAGPGHFQGVSVEPMVRHMGQEIILGSHIDPQFGPVILFGMGGQMVEVLKDVALALPPLNTNLAHRLMERTKVFRALQGVRGQKPVDLEALEKLLVRFSYLVVENPDIKEIDINPLLASPEGLLALDARVILQAEGVKSPRPAIRPYPSQYVQEKKLKDGSPITLRPIRPEDEPMVVKFHETLSDTSVFMRYFQPLHISQRVAHERLTRICFTDYDREMALVAVRKGAEGEAEVIGIGRLSRELWKEEAEYSILISDRWQNQGLGTTLMSALLEMGKAEGLKRIVGFVLPENQRMQRVSAKLGFALKPSAEDGLILASIDL
ncbi:MAG TPA: bifunctional acetate--CoA ligase family protein/GNAT family N-acetyltransferase [bacterium]|nr:bifunctional acetate--CoA ligase family protein/GNAT family N-acetyltransferase [bacterium]